VSIGVENYERRVIPVSSGVSRFSRGTDRELDSRVAESFATDYEEFIACEVTPSESDGFSENRRTMESQAMTS
jgi:hypothetical protein